MTQMMTDAQQIASRIRGYRREMGRTQEQVARDVGCGIRSYAYWESGQRAPTLPWARALARYFGCSLDDLLGA